MLEHEGTFPVVPAGVYPPQLLDACKLWQVSPDALMGWSVSHVAVTLVLPSGQKVGVSISGTWSRGDAEARSKKEMVGLPAQPVDPLAEAQPKAARQRKAK